MISQSIDARGLNCPIPVMKAKNDIKALIASQMLEVFSSDPASFTRHGCFVPFNQKHTVIIRRSNRWQFSLSDRDQITPYPAFASAR